MSTEKKIGAFFDFDGTLYDGVIAFDFLRFAIKNKALNLKEMARLPKFLFFYALDKFKLADRYSVNVMIYKRVKGWSSQNIESASREFLRQKIKRKLIPETLKIFNQHKKEGHTVVIVTSALKDIVMPVTDYLNVDDIIASEVEIKNNRYTGIIKNLPVGRNRISILKKYCEQHNIDLSKSYAYSDHYSDISMLKNVGHPVATNPERKMRRYARRNGWEILDS